MSRPKSLRVGPPSLPLRGAGTPGPRGYAGQGGVAGSSAPPGRRGAPGQLAPSRVQPAPASPPAPVRPRPRRPSRSRSSSRGAAGAAPRSSPARGPCGSCSCPRPDPGADPERAAAATTGRGGSALGRRPQEPGHVTAARPRPGAPEPLARLPGRSPCRAGPGAVPGSLR